MANFETMTPNGKAFEGSVVMTETPLTKSPPQ